jgi:hypothetical protein
MRNDANTNILTYGNNSGSGVAFDNTFKIICHKFDKTTGFITTWINGVIESSPLSFTLSGTFTMNKFAIGCLSRASNLSFWEGIFKGISVLDATVSETDRQRSEGYLAHLYNQTALLPSDHPYKNSAPLNNFTPIQTLYTSAKSVYSLRKLNPIYTGNCIRIRRSNDNAETDIGFVGNNLDTASITTFVGANSAFVTTWYEQSGNGSKAIQTTALNQPRIVNEGTLYTENGKPSIEFLGTTLLISESALATGTTQFTANVVGKRTGGSFARFISLAVSGTLDTAGTSNAVPIFGSTNTVNSYRNGIFYSAKSGTVSSLFVASSIYNDSNNIIYLNGSAGNTATFAEQPLDAVKIGLGQQAGGTTPATDWLTGAISEVTYFTTALSTTDRQLVESDQGSYYSITV